MSFFQVKSQDSKGLLISFLFLRYHIKYQPREIKEDDEFFVFGNVVG